MTTVGYNLKKISLGRTYYDFGDRYNHEGSSRKLVIQDGRPVGTMTFGNFHGSFYLWLQNYAGYCHPAFVYELRSEEAALAKAEEILDEWSHNPERPTWVC